jgi:hypothetical protein
LCLLPLSGFSKHIAIQRQFRELRKLRCTSQRESANKLDVAASSSLSLGKRSTLSRAHTINFIPINYFGKKRQGTVTFYISHKKLKNTTRVLSARLSNVSEMRYFSTHTIHTWASPLLRAPRTLNTHTLYHYYLFSYVTFDIHGQRKGYAQSRIHRARHTGTFYKNCGSSFNSKLHCLVFLFLLLFGNKNSFIVARGESERGLDRAICEHKDTPDLFRNVCIAF